MNKKSIKLDMMDLPKAKASGMWHRFGPHVHYTGHVNYNSPYEMDDDCGTCDGASCEFCREFEEPSDLMFLFQLGDVEELARLKLGEVTDDFVYELYEDRYAELNGQSYVLVLPDEYVFKELYPEEYTKVLEEKG